MICLFAQSMLDIFFDAMMKIIACTLFAHVERNKSITENSFNFPYSLHDVASHSSMWHNNDAATYEPAHTHPKMMTMYALSGLKWKILTPKYMANYENGGKIDLTKCQSSECCDKRALLCVTIQFRLFASSGNSIFICVDIAHKT